MTKHCKSSRSGVSIFVNFDVQCQVTRETSFASEPDQFNERMTASKATRAAALAGNARKKHGKKPLQ